MLLSLTGICVVAGAVLAAVNNLTAGPIVASKAAALETAIKAVTPNLIISLQKSLIWWLHPKVIRCGYIRQKWMANLLELQLKVSPKRF